MMFPATVVPSNAPPLYGGSGLHHSSRVLQENSGNRQHNEFSFSSTEYEQKFSPSIFTGENSYVHQQQTPQYYQQQPQPRHDQVTQQLYHPRPRHPISKYAGLFRHHGPNPELEARNAVEADYLYRRFRQSESYVKYRARQSKEDKGNDDQKWPDHLEKAFFRALVTWIPMGRRKIPHKDKQRGRNELIADCIYELTGEKRTRKQVSSHIQVLKPFVEGDPYIMKFLSKEDLCGQQSRHGHAAYGGGRRASMFPAPAIPHLRTNIPSLPRTSSHSIAKLKHDAGVFEPVEFEMFVQQKFRTAENEEPTAPRRLHTYTQYVPSKLEDHGLQLDDWQTIHRDFPLLAKMNSEGRLNCNVIVAKAHLSFPTHNFKAADGNTIPGVELGISFLCSSRLIPPTPKDEKSQVRCFNTFYENGNVVGEPQTCEIRFERSDREGCHGVVDTQIKFGSTYWAKTLGQLANRLLNPKQDLSQEVTAHIRSITALQEIFVASGNGYERLLVIHWTFRQSTDPIGRTSWRRMILPSSTTNTQQSHYGDASQAIADNVKAERQDSVFEHESGGTWIDVPASHSQPQRALPTLQSPFEYDSSSGSALSSATWPTSVSEGGVLSHQAGDFEFGADNSFDFNTGNINISYDHSNFDFSNFDDSAFDFGTDTHDFAADPTLDDYSQPWADSLATGNASFDTQPDTTVDESHFLSQHTDFAENQPQVNYDQQYVDQYPQHSYAEQHSFHSVHDQQAYEGAGQEMLKDEDALAALADASYLASALGTKGSQGF